MVRNPELEKTKSSIPDRIKELEDEILNTKYNKKTQGHIGLIKAKIAKLKESQEQRRKGKGENYGYTVNKSGDATVIIVGFPSVGKSTLLNKITNAESRVAAYAFTTLTCIPGMMNYKGAKIQILDVPGIVEGAASGRGRGREVLSVAINSDLVLFVVDVFANETIDVLMKEVRDAHLRINEKLADIRMVKTARGGINVGTTLTLTKIDVPTIKSILNEFRISNADLTIRSDINADQLIDFIKGNNKYIPGIIVVNKIDIASPEQIQEAKKKVHPDLLISAESGQGIEELRELIFKRLGFIRIYCKQQGRKADMNEPLIMISPVRIKDMCNRLHKDFSKRLKFARIWGSSKFPGQSIRNQDYELKDGDIVELALD